MNEWLKFGICAVLMLSGLLILLISVFGVYRFRYVLNRMHAAALGDTLGLTLMMLGYIIARGTAAVTWKLILVVAFFWVASPVSGHLLSRLEITINEKLEDNVRIAFKKEEK